MMLVWVLFSHLFFYLDMPIGYYTHNIYVPTSLKNDVMEILLTHSESCTEYSGFLWSDVAKTKLYELVSEFFTICSIVSF